MNPSSPADRQTIITNDDGASTASTLDWPWARAPGSHRPATDMVAGRSPRPARFHPVFIDMCPKGQDAVPLDPDPQALVLPGIFGVSLWVRRVILSPSQTSGSYLRPTIRSFIGISA